MIVANPSGLADTLFGKFTFAVAPVVTSINPVSGTESGGTSVAIEGSGFQAGARVAFGDRAAANVVVWSSTRIRAITPVHGAGPVDVTVTNPNGLADTLVSGFTVVAAPSSEPVYGVEVQKDVGATMRDGTVMCFQGGREDGNSRQ